MRIIINNYETIFVTTNVYISDGSKYVHVKQLQWPFGSYNILDGMFSSNLFSRLACATNPIFLKRNICWSKDVFAFLKFGQVPYPNMGKTAMP